MPSRIFMTCACLALIHRTNVPSDHRYRHDISHMAGAATLSPQVEVERMTIAHFKQQQPLLWQPIAAWVTSMQTILQGL